MGPGRWLFDGFARGGRGLGVASNGARERPFEQTTANLDR